MITHPWLKLPCHKLVQTYKSPDQHVMIDFKMIYSFKYAATEVAALISLCTVLGLLTTSNNFDGAVSRY